MLEKPKANPPDVVEIARRKDLRHKLILAALSGYHGGTYGNSSQDAVSYAFRCADLALARLDEEEARK